MGMLFVVAKSVKPLPHGRGNEKHGAGEVFFQFPVIIWYLLYVLVRLLLWTIAPPGRFQPRGTAAFRAMLLYCATVGGGKDSKPVFSSSLGPFVNSMTRRNRITIKLSGRYAMFSFENSNGSPLPISG